MSHALAIALAALTLASAAHTKIQADTIPRASRSALNAESAKGVIDQMLDARDRRNNASVDTMFLRRAPERLRLKLTLNVSGSAINVRGHAGAAGDYNSELEAQNKYTASLSASYRGLTLGLAVNPAHLAGKNKDYEFNMNAYGNKVGADVIFHSANTFKGAIDKGGSEIKVPTGMVRQNMLYLNGYYTFSSRRFSYPAAFSQSWMQLRSHGSLMLGASFTGGNLRVSHSDAIGNTASRLSIANLGIGLGYGYNYVIRNRWLLHLSTLPQLVVFSSNHTTAGGAKEKTPYKFPNIIAVGRLAVVRHFGHWLFGLTTVVNTLSTGDHDQMQLTTVKWRARLFVGIKL